MKWAMRHWPKWARGSCSRPSRSAPEKATVILTTNLPFPEWTQVIPNPRWCKAPIDRINGRARTLETGIEPYRMRGTLEYAGAGLRWRTQ